MTQKKIRSYPHVGNHCSRMISWIKVSKVNERSKTNKDALNLSSSGLCHSLWWPQPSQFLGRKFKWFQKISFPQDSLRKLCHYHMFSLLAPKWQARDLLTVVNITKVYRWFLHFIQQRNCYLLKGVLYGSLNARCKNTERLEAACKHLQNLQFHVQNNPKCTLWLEFCHTTSWGRKF